MMKSVLIITAVIFVSACNNKVSENKISRLTESPNSAVKPPIPSANIPFTIYDIEAETGDTIVHPSGSVLLFPSHSMVDAAGNVVKGKVQIQYREFYHPLDIFLSGIPMSYDSAGLPYNLQSAGMCEIRATQNGVPVFVNNEQPPQISLAAANADPSYNLYYFDSSNLHWNNRGKEDICDFRMKDVATVQISDTVFVKPLTPQKAETGMPLINIKIETGSVPELAVYNNMKFQLIASEKNFKEADSKEEWDDIRVRKTKMAGVYRLEFLNQKRKVGYLVKPVFEGDDYTAALNIFNKNNRAYESAEARRKIENIRLDKANKMQLAKNKIIDKQNEITIDKNRIAKEKYERFQKIYEQETEMQNSRINEFVFRTFSINQFGIWNVDKPLILNNSIPISLHFKDEQGKNLDNITTYIVYQNLNTVYPISNNTIRLMPENKSMFWGVTDGSFYYFTYQDFDKAGFSEETKKQDIIMHKYDVSPITYKNIQQLLGIKILNKNLPS